MSGRRAVVKGVSEAIKKTQAAAQKKLLQARKARQGADRQSTYPAPVSKTEDKLAESLRLSGNVPGTKTTISKGMSLSESPLTKTEKDKLSRLAQKAAKTDDIKDDDIYKEYIDKLVEKYGSGVDDIADKVLRSAYSTRKSMGGSLSKKTSYKARGGKAVNKKPRGCGAAQRGYGKAMKGKK